MEVLKRAREIEREGRRVIHFEVGEPDFPTASVIVEAAKRALDDGHTGYTEALGIPELRNAIADDYRLRFGINIESRRIAVTSGASGALNLLFSVLLNPGDKVLMSDPGYPCNEAFVRVVGGEPIRMPVDESTGYQPTVEIVKERWTADTVGVVLATPSNPTGSMIQKEQLESINDFVAEREAFVLVDEIYQGLVYEPDLDAVATSSLAIDPELIVVNSFSKYFGMTGWRLGWCVVPDSLIEALERAAQNLYIAPSIVAQYAALAAYSPEGFGVSEERRTRFQRRRDLMYRGLCDAGLEVPLKPEGAIYLYANISSCGLDSETFSSRLIEEYQVAVTPGTDFGSHRAHEYVRFAYTAAEDDIRRGSEIIGRAVRRFRNEI
ncbi:MAG TPA: aminotransferase [Gammaproteobacteria bacterium]|nr:aminotransferase [Gammaproteobacteria bacterium]